MKSILLTTALFCTIQSIQAQQYLNAVDSEPNKMSWMKGFPPKKDSIISAVDGSFFQFPALRYSVCHMQQFLPTTVVPSANEHRYTFETDIDKNIDSISFFPWNSKQRMTWKESLLTNYTDGIIILHKGKIVYEQYFGSLALPDF